MYCPTYIKYIEETNSRRQKGRYNQELWMIEGINISRVQGSCWGDDTIWSTHRGDVCTTL